MTDKSLETRSQLRARRELAGARALLAEASEIRKSFGPFFKATDEFADALDDARYDEQFAKAGRLISHPLPPRVRDCAVLLRDAVATPPAPEEITRVITPVINSRTGYRPPDMRAYVVSVISSLVSHGFSTAAVAIASDEIREADPATFHGQLPSEFHWIEAAKRAKARLGYEAWRCATAVAIHDKARDLLARRPEIEAAEKGARERVQAILAKNKADRIAECERRRQARQAEILSSGRSGSK